MSADPVTMEVVTVTIPFPISKGDAMRVVGAVDGYCESLKMEAFAFLSVLLGFFDLADHSRVH
jgi:hypothetical protein